jgi:leukotriene-A4 hydrolase
MVSDYLLPYEWGFYKIVILPSNFPNGGMENPLLTFASPSIIVGDKS